ncbi:NAD(P)/FAD-dependent oxidoreductase [Acaricomes phytoseiuli]|uniref:NAD(P)/FAD-dependent oxidoreductase n=1 Tax=Acaricomes phytoseiuli TaxID=291968 RepID=UPI00036A260A|nr:FAD/NAD(P)-binding oxidoreductase [Acaricomes phytoseiuli]MCW1250366.1 NAD(P)/FAD-dependent oxidoreductase [Acaricomes phytoseiuli]
MYHRTVIIGGGNAGISVAARLRRAGQQGIAVIEPGDTHYYQPLWTLVGGGQADIGITSRPQARVMPRGVSWIKDSATGVSPQRNTVHLASGRDVSYDFLVACPGIYCDWDGVPGLMDALATPEVSSNYAYNLAPKTWQMIKGLRAGTAIFTMPANPIKCGGAPQKIAYLAADYWRKTGVLQDIRIVMVLPTPALFGVEVFSRELEKVARRYGIEVRLSTEMTAIDSASRTITVEPVGGGAQERLHYDLLHAVPPQSAPGWVKRSPLADPENPLGYISVDRNTLQHTRYPNVFSLGDACSAPNSKTGAAIRKQAPVLVANLLAALAGGQGDAAYHGYASCPLVTSRRTMLLAEFDYELNPAPSIPFIDTTRERRDMWLLKRYGLPFMYWNGILKGRI